MLNWAGDNSGSVSKGGEGRAELVALQFFVEESVALTLLVWSCSWASAELPPVLQTPQNQGLPATCYFQPSGVGGNIAPCTAPTSLGKPISSLLEKTLHWSPRSLSQNCLRDYINLPGHSYKAPLFYTLRILNF